MKTLIVLTALAFLTGCANFPAVSAGVAQHTADIADQELASAEWAVCKAPTIGAWTRRYGHSPVKKEGWTKLCSDEAIAP